MKQVHKPQFFIVPLSSTGAFFALICMAFATQAFTVPALGGDDSRVIVSVVACAFNCIFYVRNYVDYRFSELNENKSV